MKICLVCASGGHLTELMQIMEAFDDHEVFFITYDSERTRKMQNTYVIPKIGLNIVRMITGSFTMFTILGKERPDVIVSTGSEIAIPVFYWAKLMGIRTVYIESWCRVHSRSGTGPLVYPVADLFLVQWPEMLEKYGPKARYMGGVM